MKKVNKSKLAKRLGISRPTLNKRLKGDDKEINELFLLEVDRLNERQCIKLSATHKGLAPESIDSVLEFLQDNKYLNECGTRFANSYWKLFIQE